MSDKEMLIQSKREISLQQWREKEKTALELLQIVGELRFDHSIELVLFRRDIYDARPSEVINDHLFAKNYVNMPMSVETSLSLANAIANIKNLAPARIDIGKLGAEWLTERSNYSSIDEFVNNKLRDFIGEGKNGTNAKDVVLYGFGRIGRLAARRIINLTGKGEQLRLRAIVVRPSMPDRYEEARKRAALLRKDSVHGKFRGTIDISPDGSSLIINGNLVQLIYAKSPEEIDYTEYGIENALVIDNTGVWRDKEKLAIHLRPGISQVMLTAPAKGVPNIVYGVNHHNVDFEKDNIYCAASCTTNAIVPIIKAVDDSVGIERGHIETVHAYTSDQNLLDNFHKKPRRGRAAAINMVLTDTGVTSAVSKVFPHLTGKLTGNAVRVPTPNVSLAIMSLSIKQETTVEAINEVLKNASLYGELVEQLHYSTSTEFVSSMAVGMTHAAYFDAPSTIVSDNGKNVTLYAWYDNEFGYTCQVVRLAKFAAKVRRYSYY